MNTRRKLLKTLVSLPFIGSATGAKAVESSLLETPSTLACQPRGYRESLWFQKEESDSLPLAVLVP